MKNKITKRLFTIDEAERHVKSRILMYKFTINVSLAAVQKAPGHTSIKSTEIYLNFTDKHTLGEFRDKW